MRAGWAQQPGSATKSTRSSIAGGQQQQQHGALLVPSASKKPVKTVKVGGAAAPPKSKTQRGGGVATTSSSKRRGSGGGGGDGEAKPRGNGSRFYFNFTGKKGKGGFPFPIGPAFERRTVRTEVVKGSIWTFEQTQSIDLFAVYTPVRMTVIKLRSGGLWVHAPVAPTQECVRLIKELGLPVEFIVLPTFAYEHKVFVGPFARRFPRAQVYVAPYQWSFPLNLPPQAFGIFPAGELGTDASELPWGDEIDHKLFVPPPIGVGDYVRFTEVAFFHRASRSLLVTDAVVYVVDDPPEVIPRDALLRNAADGFLPRFVAGGRSAAEVDAVARVGPAPDTRDSLRLGWQRMSLLVLYFNPSDLLTPQASFDSLARRLIVGPVVRTLVYSKVPRTVAAWVDAICADWPFCRVIPCHFNAPVAAGPAEFRAAFDFVFEAVAKADGGAEGAGGGGESGSGSGSTAPSVLGGWLGNLFGGGGKVAGKRNGVDLLPADLRVLQGLDALLLRVGAIVPDAEKRADDAAAAAARRRRSSG